GILRGHSRHRISDADARHGVDAELVEESTEVLAEDLVSCDAQRFHDAEYTAQTRRCSEGERRRKLNVTRVTHHYTRTKAESSHLTQAPRRTTIFTAVYAIVYVRRDSPRTATLVARFLEIGSR